MANSVFTTMHTDIMGAGQFGSDTVILSSPSIVAPATLTDAHVQMMRTDEEAKDRERGESTRTEMTLRLLVASLPASFQTLSDNDWSEASATVSGTAYGIDEAVTRHGLVRLLLGGELLQERTRQGMRR